VINIFNDILTVFKDLIYLTLYEASSKNRVPLFFNDPPPPTFRSSTLLKLNVRLQCFEDCLSLLDGRFDQLHTLYVNLTHIRTPQEMENQVSFTRKKNSVLSNNKINFVFLG
jgi:hypothetical protein